MTSANKPQTVWRREHFKLTHNAHKCTHAHTYTCSYSDTQTYFFSLTLTPNVVKMLDAGSCIVLPIKDFYLEKYTNPSNCKNFHHSSLSLQMMYLVTLSYTRTCLPTYRQSHVHTHTNRQWKNLH